MEKKKKSKLTVRNIAITTVSGGVAGGMEICFTYPFEFAKTQKHLYADTYKKLSVVGCWKHTYKANGGGLKGFSSLYRGIVPLIVFGAPKCAVRFTAFEWCSEHIGNMFPHWGLVQSHTVCGFLAGAVEASIVTTPAETMKVLLIDDKLKHGRFRGTWHGITTVIKERGIGGVYKGLSPTIMKQGSNQMMRFPIYFYLKSYFLDGDHDRSFQENGVFLGTLQQMACGGIAGAVSVLGNTPVDVVKSKMQGLEAEKLYEGSVMRCIKETYKTEGVLGFYQGMGARMGRVTCDVALTFLFMESVKTFIKGLWKEEE